MNFAAFTSMQKTRRYIGNLDWRDATGGGGVSRSQRRIDSYFQVGFLSLLFDEKAQVLCASKDLNKSI